MARILIVDDERDLVGTLAKRLVSLGHETEGAFSAHEAEEKIGLMPFDIVILDFSMPIMKGDEFCQKLRENPETKDVPVIILTAYRNRDVQYFKSVGATDVMYKPYDVDELVAKIEQYAS